MIHDNELSSFNLLVPVHIHKKDLILISLNFVDFLKISNICIWLYQVVTFISDVPSFPKHHVIYLAYPHQYHLLVL